MTILTAAPVIYEAEVIEVDPSLWRELDRLSREADPDTQAAFNRFLDRHGRVTARQRATNLVTDIGARYLVNTLFPAPGATAVLPTWYIGLRGTGTPANSDTMASHATWTEITSYTQSARPVFTTATATTGRSVTNSANRATYTPSANITVFGVFMVNNSTKGGSTGTLYSVSTFGSSQALTSGQTYRLQATAAVP